MLGGLSVKGRLSYATSPPQVTRFLFAVWRNAETPTITPGMLAIQSANSDFEIGCGLRRDFNATLYCDNLIGIAEHRNTTPIGVVIPRL